MQVKGHCQGQTFWYRQKGLNTRNTHVKFESPTCQGSKDMTKIKVFKMQVKGQGQGKKKYGNDGKVLSNGVHM